MRKSPLFLGGLAILAGWTSCSSPELGSGSLARQQLFVAGGAGHALAAAYSPRAIAGQRNTESYAHREENRFHRVADKARSTFSVDVDTASYSNVRRMIRAGQPVPPGAVRTEEFINSFRYEYPAPVDGKAFAVATETARCPWADGHWLVRIGIQGRQVPAAARPPANLVFLLDVSGSMQDDNKLPLVKHSMKLLAEQARPQDRVAIVVYAGASGLVLPSTPGSAKAKILAALSELEAGGSTNGGEGLVLAYKTARANRIPNGINRVILCTDGDFNVGTSDEAALVELVRKEAGGGIDLTVLGFGMGNLKDSTLEAIANKGDGQYAYVDSAAEARKLFGEQLGGTLQTIAKDAKIQVEFNPRVVGSWRLIGYENRLLEDADFNDDTKDAGEIGAGHRVTAFYEIIPAGAAAGAGADDLKYQRAELAPGAAAAEIMTVKVRAKAPTGGASGLTECTVQEKVGEFGGASGDFQFATAVAAFGQWLAKSEHIGKTGKAEILRWSAAATGGPDAAARAEFRDLVGRAKRRGGD
jgi:Ca-activated chloride channel homolog